MSLVSIAATIEPPTGEAGQSLPSDRLAELAQWWSQAGASSTPARVEQLWAPGSFEPPGTVEDVIPWAIAEADRIVDGGADVVLLSVPAGAIASAVLAARLMHLDAVDAAGWPSDTGISDQRWIVIVTTIRDELRRLRGPLVPDADEGESPSSENLLRRLDDAALAAGCAVMLRCSNRRTPLIVEGLAGAVCGLFAHRLNPASLAWWQASDGPISAVAAADGVPGARDGLHDRVLAAMHREPLMRLGLSRADGTAARIALGMLAAAIDRETE